MPPINRYTCNECGFELPPGWGGHTYAVDDPGRRVVCPHPSEPWTSREVTGMSCTEARAAARSGFAQDCVCSTCLTQFTLDIERDPRICPACASPEVATLRELIGKRCPRCRVGTIEEGSLVRWTLDPDADRLPVPQVVRELVQFEDDRQVPESLRAAAQFAESLGDHTFLTVVSRLLRWWEGDYFSKDKEPKDSLEMPAPSFLCKALPEVLRGAPSLAALIVIRGNHCEFAPTVAADERRGIKNYVRRHRKHEVWC